MSLRMRLFWRAGACLIVVAVCLGCDGEQERTTARVSVATPSSTVPSASDIKEVSRRWEEARSQVHTLRVSVTFKLLKADGSRWPVPENVGAPTSIDYVYKFIPEHHELYRITMHYPEGDFIALYDGEHSYRYRAWSNELYRPIHDEVYKPGEYWPDEYYEAIENNTLVLFHGYTERYRYINKQLLDGRQVVELEDTQAALNEYSHVYLDEVSYLPYRQVDSISSGFLAERYNIERFEQTYKNAEVNSTLDESAFKLDLPDDVIHVYNEVQDQTYGSTLDAAQHLDFKLFELQGGKATSVDTDYIVEKDGKRSAVVSMYTDDGIITEGSYMPEEANQQYLPRDPTSPTDMVSTVNVNGQPGTLRLYWDGKLRDLTFTREGTIIRIRGRSHEDDIEKVLELARGLQPIETNR